jgi:hypothetical protein
VTEQDESGHEPSRHERLSGLQLAQRLAAGGGTVLLFDEAEDLFTRVSYGEDGPAATSRVFVHRLLEQTPVPVIWTANQIGGLGPAVLRRMTICLEQKVPNVAVRTRLWRRMAMRRVCLSPTPMRAASRASCRPRPPSPRPRCAPRAWSAATPKPRA